MSSSLDMSLDDIIKKNKGSEGSNGNFRGGRGRGRSVGGGFGTTGPGPSGPVYNHPPIHTAPYSIPQAVQVPDVVWQPGSSTETSSKLYISNLDYGVSNEDVKLLFSDVGELKSYSLHYDKSGRSKGTAEVVFHRPADALAAIKRYNNVQLDGKPMNIELVGVNNFVIPTVVPPTGNGILGNPPDNFRSGQDRVGRQGWIRGGRGRGYGNGGGRGYGNPGGRGHGRDGGGGGRGRGEKVSAEDLDADLDKYHSEAMQIN